MKKLIKMFLVFTFINAFLVGCIKTPNDQIQENEESSAGTNVATSTLQEMIIPSPTHGTEIQLTYRSSNSNISEVWGITIHCLEERKNCFGEPQLLFEFPGIVKYADWSNDGQRIAFAASTNDKRNVIVVSDWNGENVIEIVSDTVTKFIDPLWSPDNDELVYSTISQFESSRIYLVDMTTMVSREIVVEPSLGLMVMDWSPDGKKYLYQGYDTEGTSQIYTSNIDGSNLVNLTNTSKIEQNYSGYFSPNGDLISFGRHTYDKVRFTTQSVDLLTITVDGTDERNLTNNPEDIYALGLGWHPSGSWILLYSGLINNLNTFLLNVEDLNRIEVPLDKEADFLSWRVIQ